MASDGGLIALTFLLLATLLALLYCLLRQIGATKQCVRRVCTLVFGGTSFLPRSMASGCDRISGLDAQDEDEEGDYTMDRGGGGGGGRGRAAGGGGGGRGGGGGLFWKSSPSEEERSILGCRTSTNVALSGNNFHKSTFDSMNSYHSADYTYLQQEQMAAVTANSAKLPPPVTNGISTTKSTHAASSITVSSEPTQRAKTASNVQPDYTYAIPPPPPPPQPKKETAAAPTANVISATPLSPQQASSPGSRRRRQTEQDQKPKKSTEKSPLIIGSAGAPPSAAIRAPPEHQTMAMSGGSGRPTTPDFRYTVLADEDDNSLRKGGPIVGSSHHDANKMSATNGNSHRSGSMDSGNVAAQLTADTSGENARRHSLTSMTTGQVSPALSIDNASPSGSVSDFDPESLLVLDDFSGACSRRTSISSVDSNLERLDETSAPSLMRALSSDSLDSTCSIMDLSVNDPEIGQLETRLYYDSSSQYLHVWILQAYDIKPIASSGNGGLVEYWVVVFLLPHQKPLYRTQLLPYAPVLQFHEQFRQRVRDQDLRKLALLCQIYCRTRPPHEMQSVGAALAAAGATPPLMPTSSSTPTLPLSKRSSAVAGNDLVGQAKVRLKDVELSVANTLWLSLLPRLDNSGIDRHLGELLFSLSYLPTAERLTVVVAKARNIRTSDGINPEKIMVRVYLVYGAKISKKKTSIKSTVEGSASFNESIIFSLSQNLVPKVYLRLSVVEPLSTKSTGEQRTIGHVTVGSRRTSKEFGHWQKMTEQPRKPVSMWHHLAPKSQKLT